MCRGRRQLNLAQKYGDMMASQILRGTDGRVGFVELFFDLVFVFAITQISHNLLSHYTAQGLVETAIMFQAIWMVWIYTTWVLNLLDPNAVAVRALLFAMMLGGVFVSMAVPQAFGARGWVFALAYVGMQLGRTVFFLVMIWDNPATRLAYGRILIWFGLSAIFWIAGGFASVESRTWLWLIAIGIEFSSGLVGFFVPRLGRAVSTDWNVLGGHMAERCGLFVIICLGESLLVSGGTFAKMVWTPGGIAAFLAAVAGAIGMWWVYFHIGYTRAVDLIERSGNPGRLARVAYSYCHIPIVAGIVVSAVGSERAIAHPGDAGVLVEAASVIGGVALFLIGNGLFKWATSARFFPLSHIAGLVLCILVTFVGPYTSLLVLNAAAAVILGIVAVWEHLSYDPDSVVP